jgi:hypothetical protein
MFLGHPVHRISCLCDRDAVQQEVSGQFDEQREWERREGLAHLRWVFMTEGVERLSILEGL